MGAESVVTSSMLTAESALATNPPVATDDPVLATNPAVATAESAAGKPLNLVVLASGGGSNLQAILDHIAAATLAARVAAVVSDRADAFALTRAARHHLPTEVVRPGARFDAELQAAVAAYEPDLVVLAGFMRIVSAAFVARFGGRVVNIHPSLLPKFKGLDTHARALAAGETRHGATVHWVTAALDAGPIIQQAAVTVAAGDDAESLRRRVLAVEHRLYPSAIQRLAQGRIGGVGVAG